MNAELSKSVNEIQLWANTNKLPLNKEKTKVMMITGRRLASKVVNELAVVIDGDKFLKNTNKATLLGLDIDSKLCFSLFLFIYFFIYLFSEHIDKICKKLAKRIGILRKIRSYLPLKRRVLYYNAVIYPIFNYANVIWTACDKDLLTRVLKLQKRVARVILAAEPRASSVALFNSLHWIPFYEDSRINKCQIIHKRIHGGLPRYLEDSIVVNSQRHSLNTRYSNSNIICPRYKRETDGGRTFAVTGAKLWNSLPLELRKNVSLKVFKNKMWNSIFEHQKLLNHFIV